MAKRMLTEMNLNGTSDFVVLARESQHAVSQICFNGVSHQTQSITVAL